LLLRVRGSDADATTTRIRGVARPQLLLVPEFTELEWAQIRPDLEQWAEVASFDLPGVGDEPSAQRLDRDAIVMRGLEELDRRGWERCFVCSDGWGIASATRLALRRPEAVLGMALGHTKLSHRREGERAPINAAVFDAMTELIEKDHEEFVRYAIAQVTGGSVDEELARQMVERFPPELIAAGWHTITRDDEDIGELLGQLDCPLLFAKHQGCLMSSEEGFDAAAGAFPRARTITVEDAPTSSREFAEALREFCMEVRRLKNSRRRSGSAS
jgi:pimeloyl-ACP methyl ester carboxylesterase